MAPLAKTLATNNVPIQALFILDGIIDDIAIDNISQLTQITDLNLLHVNGLSERHLTNLARNLPEWQCLRYKFNRDDGSDVLTIDVLIKV